ncbi:MAG TPA: phospho-N-acetylmuramoyl-pentapeptide-transferase [Candidatus Acidoferrales bacterium]|nr:phospho-N-acetylmuramoyl-pentapeptide-transferase [Candidatus Acidoferrales bacterium]
MALGGDLVLPVLLHVFGGFVVALAAGLIALPLLRRLQLRQHAYEDAPQSHQAKTGTPTMGGIVFIVPFLFPLFAFRVPLVLPTCFLIVACGAIGMLDDLLGIMRGRNQGLRASTKLLASALVAIVFLRWIDASPAIYPRDVLFHAGDYMLTAPHWVWLLLGIAAITGTIHAVNLTDGLDGLATGTMIPPLLVFGLNFMPGYSHAGQDAALLGLGACFAFLIFNRYPAKMFMGDTGSLALGALLSGAAILEGEMLLLILIGGVFVAEALSVIAQVTYFKATGGKRILRMSPLHHHFELGGWPETKVTLRFWTASLVLSAIGWFVVR